MDKKFSKEEIFKCDHCGEEITSKWDFPLIVQDGIEGRFHGWCLKAMNLRKEGN